MARTGHEGSDAAPDAVAAYKRLLAAIIDRRPSGTRLRLSAALGKNRSFISQITSSAYPTPVPAQHVETILSVCRFSTRERREFLAAYTHAHPTRKPPSAPARPAAIRQDMRLPDLGHEDMNERLHDLVSSFARQLIQLVEESHARGDRR